MRLNASETSILAEHDSLSLLCRLFFLVSHSIGVANLPNPPPGCAGQSCASGGIIFIIFIIYFVNYIYFSFFVSSFLTVLQLLLCI
jgi:hypothetical protein